MPDASLYDDDAQDAYQKLRNLGVLGSDTDAHDAAAKLVKLGVLRDLSGGSTYAAPKSTTPSGGDVQSDMPPLNNRPAPIPTSDPRSPYHKTGFLPTLSGFAGNGVSASKPKPTPAPAPRPTRPAVSALPPAPSLAQLAVQSARNPVSVSNLTQNLLPPTAPTGPQLRQTPQRNLVQQMEQGIFQHDTPILSLYDSAVLTPTYLARAKQAKDRGDNKGAAQALVDLDNARNSLGVGSGSAVGVGTRAAVNAAPGAVGGIAGAAAGGRAGLALSSILPVPPIAKAAIAGAGGIAGMLGGAGLIDAGKAALTRGLVGGEGYNEYLRQQQADQTQNPVASFVGRQVPFAMMMRPAGLDTPIKSILAGAGTNAGINVASQGVGMLDAKLHGRPVPKPDLLSLTEDTGAGAFFGGGHTALGEGIHNFGEGLVPGRLLPPPPVPNTVEGLSPQELQSRGYQPVVDTSKDAEGYPTPTTGQVVGYRRTTTAFDGSQVQHVVDPQGRTVDLTHYPNDNYKGATPGLDFGRQGDAAQSTGAVPTQSADDFLNQFRNQSGVPRPIPQIEGSAVPAPYVPSEYTPAPIRTPRQIEAKPDTTHDVSGKLQSQIDELQNTPTSGGYDALNTFFDRVQSLRDAAIAAGYDKGVVTRAYRNLDKAFGPNFDNPNKVQAAVKSFTNTIASFFPDPVAPHEMTRAEFEATGQDLMHGTSRQFDRFGIRPDGKPVTRTGGGENRNLPTRRSYFTDQEPVANTFAGNKGYVELSFPKWAASELGGSADAEGFISTDQEDLDTPELWKSFYENVNDAIKKGDTVYYHDYESATPDALVKADRAEDVPRDNLTEGGAVIVRKGREPRVINTKVYGATLDLTKGAVVPQSVGKAFKEQSGLDLQSIVDNPGKQGDFWHEYSNALIDAAEQAGYGKIKVLDAYESGHQSVIGLHSFVGHNTDPHRAFVETALAAGKAVPAKVLADYPDLIKNGKPNAKLAVQTPAQQEAIIAQPGDATRTAGARRPQDVQGTARTNAQPDVPATVPAAPTGRNAEGTPYTETLATANIKVHPLMQYKRGVNSKAVTDQFAKQQDFKMEHAGMGTVFRDFDGTDYAVDMHHRLEFINRAKTVTNIKPGGGRVNVPREMNVKVLDARDGWTPEMARNLGIMNNLAENKGDAIDAADALVGTGTPQEIEDARKVASALPKIALTRDVQGLVLLGEAGRAMVRNKTMKPAVGAAIGEVLRGDMNRQAAAIEQAMGNKAITSYDDGLALANAVKEEELAERPTDQQGMFDDDPDAAGVVQNKWQSTAGKQAELQQSVIGGLKASKSALLNPTKADLMEGENINVEARKAQAEIAGKASGMADVLFQYDAETKAARARIAGEVVSGKITNAEGVKQLREVIEARGTRNINDILAENAKAQDGKATPAVDTVTGKPVAEKKPAAKAKPAKAESDSAELASPVRTLDAPAPTSNNPATATATTARIKPDNIAYDNEPLVKPRELIRRLGRVVNAQIRTAKGKAGGTYDPATGATNIRYNGDLDTALHEGAHRLIEKSDSNLLGQWKGNGVRSPFDDELIPHFSQYGSVTKSGPRSKLSYARSEGAAEWVRAWMVNPDEATQAAPKFAAHFEANVPEAVRTQLAEIGREVRRYAGAPAVERGPLAREDTEVQAKALPDLLRGALDTVIGTKGDSYGDFAINRLDRAQTVVQDSLKPAMKAYDWAANIQGLNGVTDVLPQNDFRILARLVGGVGEKTAEMLETGLVLPSGKKATDGGIKWLLEPFDRSSEDTLKRDVRDATTLMIAERTIEKGGQTGNAERVSGIGGGIYSDTEEAKQQIAELQSDPARYKKLQEGAARYRQWATSLLDYQVESGRLSPEARDAYVKNNEYYVDMHRIEEGFDQSALAFTSPVEQFRGAGRTKLGKTATLNNKFKGSVKEIADPFYSLIDQTYKTHAESDRNAAKIAFRDMLLPQAGAVAGSKTSLAEVMRKADKNSVHTMKVYVDGKEEVYDLHPDVYQALNDFMASDNPTSIEKVARFVSAGLLRKAVTSDPGFLVRNVIRDSTERPFKSEVGSNPFAIFSYKALQDTNVRTYKLSGAGGSGHYLQSRKGYARAMKEAVRELSREGKGIITTPADIALLAADKYDKLKEGSELVNRIAEFNKAYDYATNKLGYDERNATLYAGAQARGLMDFGVAGTLGRQISHYIPFTNANVQGQAAMFKAAKRNKGLFLAKLGLLAASSVANLLLIKAFDKGGEKLKEYRNLPGYQRDLFWNIPMPDPIGWLRIPKGFELAVLASGLERATDKLLGNQHAMDGYFSDPNGGKLPFLSGTLAQNLLPNAIDPDNLGGPFRGLYSLQTNYDGFRQKPIIPYYEQQKPLEERKGTGTASRIGQGIGALLQSDPRKVDYFIQSQTGGLGKDALLASDIGRTDKYTSPTQYLNSATGLFTEAPGTNAMNVQRVDRQLQDAGVTTKNPMRPLKDAYYGARSATAKNTAARNLRTYADGAEVQRTIQQAQTRKDIVDDYAGTGKERDDAKSKEMSGRLRSITKFMIGKDNQPDNDKTMQSAGEVAKLQLQFVQREMAGYDALPASPRMTDKEREDDRKKYQAQLYRSLQGMDADGMRKLLQKR